MPTPLQIRIQAVQRRLKLNPTGIFNAETCTEIEKLKRIVIPTGSLILDRKKVIQKSLGFTGTDVDGIFGPATLTRIEDFLDKTLPEIPNGASMIVSKRALDIIINSEISSKASYQIKYKFPVWPELESGITIGIGYDLGYVTSTQFQKDWGGFLSDSVFNSLNSVVGKKGDAAKNALTTTIKKIEISWEVALEVFYTKSMPKYAVDTKKAFPGVEKLPPDAQGALLSLVYNRGALIDNSDRRKEMKNIVGFVASGNLAKIASEIRSMKRLWDIKKAKGLHIRRDAEADLVANASFFMQTNEYIFV
jgi:GH24 family phage-related lysozyme (muramidase)